MGAFQRSMSRTRCSARRLSARSEPTKSSTNGSAGYISSSAGVANWARIPPSLRIAIRSPILIASSMSWVTKTIVLRRSACRRRNSFCRRSRLIGSMAPKGSSISISGGSHGEGAGHADALALAAGELGRVALRELLGQADDLQQLADAVVDALLVPAQQMRDGGDVLADRAVGEQADLLDDVADLASQLGRARPLTLSPPIRMSPSVMSIMRLTIRMAVVLPQPDGPTSTQISPAGTSSERWSTAGFSAPG